MRGETTGWRWLLPRLGAVFAVGLLLRAALVWYFAVCGGEPVSIVLSGHDGAEYLKFARALGSGGIASVPLDARRHDPGWPLVLAAFAGMKGFVTMAWLVNYVALCGAALLLVELVKSMSGMSDRHALFAACAVMLCYPAQVYYSCFVLSEPLFLLMILGSIVTYVRAGELGQWPMLIAAYGLAGMAALVRGPGMLLAGAFVAAALEGGYQGASRGRFVFRHVALLPVAVWPWLCWTLIAKHVWGGNLVVHRPQFGLPFSGFGELSSLGIVRVVYVFACDIFAFVSVVLLAREVRKTSDPATRSTFRVAALFSGIFLLFHLCLKSLHYIDRDVLTFNYQDRYYVGMLPLLVLPWVKLLKWRVVVPLGICSVFSSAYWGRHYFLTPEVMNHLTETAARM